MSRSLRRRALAAAALALAALALPAAAQANRATLSIGELTYVQTTDTGSTVTTAIQNGAVRLRSSSGIQQISGAGCSRVDANEISCTGVARMVVRQHAGGDTFTSRTSLPTVVHANGGADFYVAAAHSDRNRVEYFGGNGVDTVLYALAQSGVSVTKDELANDGRFVTDFDNIHTDVERLSGSSHNDILRGFTNTVGSEFFNGGMGVDTLDGGGGPDSFESVAVADGADRINGGAGFDTISYEHRTRPVNVTLNFGGADDGEAGERDEITGANEMVIGGKAGDTLRAPAASTALHILDGGGGNDTVEGGEGPDQLNGGLGSDTLLANGGDDMMFAFDGEGDVVGCGTGNDTAQLDNRDGFNSCENRTVIGKLRLTPATIAAKVGQPVPMRLSWSHPKSWRKLRKVELRLVRNGVAVGEITVRPRGERIAAGGAVALGRASRITHKGKTVTARLSIRLAKRLAGQELALEVEATDVRGRRQLEPRAGTIRVAR